MTHVEPHNGKTEEKSTCLISRPRATSQPTKMLEAHLEEGALCSLDGPGGAPRRCFAAQRTSWPASFSPCSSPCDCSKKKSARAYGRNGSVCVQSLHFKPPTDDVQQRQLFFHLFLVMRSQNVLPAELQKERLR